ncbi:MAG: hypothetical protein ONB05_09285 [candidate division KSB1 bacterium]|nr:hypothetical protein [candidate division KSB1 bacterium]
MAKIILIIAAIVEFVFRGLPAFFGSKPVADLFALEYIKEALVYVHPFGALMLVFGVMFFIAAKDPVKYKFVVDMGILRYALGFVQYFITLGMLGSLATFWWVHMVIDLVLLILLIISRPKVAA